MQIIFEGLRDRELQVHVGLSQLELERWMDFVVQPHLAEANTGKCANCGRCSDCGHCNCAGPGAGAPG